MNQCNRQVSAVIFKFESVYNIIFFSKIILSTPQRFIFVLLTESSHQNFSEYLEALCGVVGVSLFSLVCFSIFFSRDIYCVYVKDLNKLEAMLLCKLVFIDDFVSFSASASCRYTNISFCLCPQFPREHNVCDEVRASRNEPT